MTLEQTINLEEMKAVSYEKHACFSAMYSELSAKDAQDIADRHKQFALWLTQLKACRDKYNECKEVLKGEVVTSKDSADHKAAYAVVQTFKEIFEEVGYDGKTT